MPLGVESAIADTLAAVVGNIVDGQLSLANVVVNKGVRPASLASVVSELDDAVPDLLSRGTVGGFLQESADVSGASDLLAVGEVVVGIDSIDVVGDDLSELLQEALLVTAEGAVIAVNSLGRC